MKVLVTGSTGFVGRWLTAELAGAGHSVIPTPGRAGLDIEDEAGLAELIREHAPDAIAHLAGIAYAPDAARAEQEASRVNVGGARALFATLAATGGTAAVLVAGSSDVYGSPRADDLPLTEQAPLRAAGPYALSKLGQERAAAQGAARAGVPLALARAFNHTGPGQRAEFVAPALARRVLAAQRSSDPTVRVGNVDVRRDFTDVRDTVRAYRLVLEHLTATSPAEPLVINVASGHATSIRALLTAIGAAAGLDPHVVIDADLVRDGDPPEIVGDSTRLHALTGWKPSIPLERTAADLVGSLVGSIAS